MNTSKDDWNQHWETNAESARYNPAQRYRRKLIYERLNLGKTSSQIRILDVGSGQGDCALELQSRCKSAEVLGLELSRSGVEISRRKVPSAVFLQQDLLQNHEPPEQYREWATHAVCSEVLEHVDHPEKILQNTWKYLAPNAQFILTVPGGPMSAFDKHIGHRKHYRLDDFKDLVQRSGYTVEGISGAGYPFFNLYRMVVLARGKKLAQDVASDAEGKGLSITAKAAMSAFDFLFKLNIDQSRFGWQVICIARKCPP